MRETKFRVWDKISKNMMTNQYKLYFYDDGNLRKVEGKHHSHNTIDSIKRLILKKSNNKYFSTFWKNSQFVVVKDSDESSRIVKVWK